MKKIFLTTCLVLMSGALANAGATYYIRPDGSTNVNCTGLTDAAYPGSGTAQACAFEHPSWVAGGGGGAQLMVGGDTLIIDDDNHSGGQAQYASGYTMPNHGGPDCNPTAFAYGCGINSLPPGPDANHLTRVLGKKYASGCSAKPQIWGQGYVDDLILNGSNFDVECLEITDHSACIYSGPTGVGTVDGFPTQCVRTGVGATDGNWATDGLLIAGNVSDNITLNNLYVHGIARYGVEVGSDNTAHTFGTITLTNSKVIANGWGDFQTNNEMSSTDGTGTITISYSDIDWSGCGERYPLQDASNPSNSSNVHNCANQGQDASAADSIAFSYATGGSGMPGHWVISHDRIRWGTQDAIDTLHGNGTGSVSVDHTLFEGNQGQVLKVTGSPTYFENNVVNSNCSFFDGQSFTATTDQNGNANNGRAYFCRANGTAINVLLQSNSKFYGYNNTFNSGGSNIVFELNGNPGGSSPQTCNAGTLVSTQGNIYLGGYNWLDDTYQNGAGGNGRTVIQFNGGGSTGGTCDAIVLTGDYESSDGNFKSSDYGCTGAHSLCSADPKVVGPITNGHNSQGSYYHGLNYLAADYLQSGSPLRGASNSGLTFQNGTADYNNTARPPWDIGALIYGSAGQVTAVVTKLFTGQFNIKGFFNIK